MKKCFIEELVDDKPDHRKPDGLLSYFSGFFCFRQFISGQLVLVVFLPANLLISIYYLFSIYYITYKNEYKLYVGSYFGQ